MLAREVKRIKGKSRNGSKDFSLEASYGFEERSPTFESLSPQENESSSLQENSSLASENAIEVCISIHGDRRCCRLPPQRLLKTLSKIPKP